MAPDQSDIEAICDLKLPGGGAYYDCVTYDDARIILQAIEDRYRTLLVRYIAHVSACEGANFIESGNLHDRARFTEPEWKLLEQLATESKKHI
jgi:hypothetical protein